MVHRNFHKDGGDSSYTIKLAHLLKAHGGNVCVLTLQDGLLKLRMQGVL